MASTLSDSLSDFTWGGWRAGRTAAEALALDIKDSAGSFPTNAVAVLQLFDNVAYHAVTMEDTIILCRKDQQWKYHVGGDLLLAPPELLAPYIKNCTAVFEGTVA